MRTVRAATDWERTTLLYAGTTRSLALAVLNARVIAEHFHALGCAPGRMEDCLSFVPAGLYRMGVADSRD